MWCLKGAGWIWHLLTMARAEDSCGLALTSLAQYRQDAEPQSLGPGCWYARLWTTVFWPLWQWQSTWCHLTHIPRSSLKNLQNTRSGEMAQGWHCLLLFMDWTLVPRTCIKLLTPTCNSSSRGSSALSGLLMYTRGVLSDTHTPRFRFFSYKCRNLDTWKKWHFDVLIFLIFILKF